MLKKELERENKIQRAAIVLLAETLNDIRFKANKRNAGKKGYKSWPKVDLKKVRKAAEEKVG